MDLFSVERPEWGPTGVAAELGIAKSSAHALLASLAATGLLERHGRGRFRLGWRTVALGRTMLATSAYRDALVPAARRLAARYGETVHVAARERESVLYLFSERPVGGVAKPASDVPLGSTPLGQVLMSEAERGYAVGLQRRLEGVTCAAAALRPAAGEPATVAVGLCAASDRFARRSEEYAGAVVAASERMSRAVRQ